MSIVDIVSRSDSLGEDTTQREGEIEADAFASSLVSVAFFNCFNLHVMLIYM